MLAQAQTLRNIRHPIAPFNNLDHCVQLELFGEIAFEDLSLLSSNLEKKASTNLGLFNQNSR
jgi:hypothetical protein